MERNRETTEGRSDGVRRIAMSEVREHRTLRDAWIVLDGKVYDVTSYMAFHPGGKSKLLLGCKNDDATTLFRTYHAYINYEQMLSGSFLGWAMEG